MFFRSLFSPALPAASNRGEESGLARQFQAKARRHVPHGRIMRRSHRSPKLPNSALNLALNFVLDKGIGQPYSHTALQ